MKPQHPEHLLVTDGPQQLGGALSLDTRNPSTGEWNAIVGVWADEYGYGAGRTVQVVPAVAPSPTPADDAAVREVARRAGRALTDDLDPDAEPVALAEALDGDVVLADEPREDVEVSAAEIIAAIAEGRVPRGRHRQPKAPRSAAPSGPARMRKPTLYLAAALVGATGVGLLTTGGTEAQADPAVTAAEATAAEVTSVADALGLQATPDAAVAETDAVTQLQQMAASRAQRETEQEAAAQTQAAADQAAIDAAAEAARPKAVLPVDGARLSSTFGYRWGTLHAGIDLAAPMLTPEYAAMDGVVIKAGPASGFGQAVYIQHENGDVTVYGHMETILVTEGQVVQAGETIALLGSRGQSTGPHLHFEVHVGGIDGEKIDPIPWLAERGVVVS
ncbi:Murein DD-endopeptidase MepM and murein hydrolase activator NlpD, contain LysM domain [Klenkia soli]|uniref:Murein DD-endopeptidase MepM and murein hydrolase activator NlpD, contain LysM domain n=1 Tax=Klenkia soli TaxID=1052260 RepID=A0A1H0BFF4_9ACTN|nr:M23 family metallopeptidase [Klenkia soli]SDN44342.1 Murein DD-endopeptidase MepM and murein hydrolase activator NlpD, contain LysM domain [Klenkia soli]